MKKSRCVMVMEWKKVMGGDPIKSSFLKYLLSPKKDNDSYSFRE